MTKVCRDFKVVCLTKSIERRSRDAEPGGGGGDDGGGRGVVQKDKLEQERKEGDARYELINTQITQFV